MWVAWALAIPDTWTLDLIDELAQGFASMCGPASTPLIGGNLTRTPGPMVINVTIGGRLAGARPLTRTGARPGDRVCVSGVLGNATLGYLRPNEETRLLRHEWRPHLEEAATLAQNDGITAMMDISDGLLLDASRIAACSQVSIDIDSRSVPVSHLYQRYHNDNIHLAMTGGEDYVLLFTCAKDVELPAWAVPIDGAGWAKG